jgi:molecular chaperone GrpE
MNEPKNDEDAFNAALNAASDLPQSARANDALSLEGADIVREAAQIAALSSELAELKDRYLRSVADMENLRKRAEREKNDAAQFAFSRFAKELLNVADNFERALDIMTPEKRLVLPADVQSVFDGIEATQRQLMGVFERFAIKRIDAVGQKFNPNLHDAIAELPSDQHAAGSIIAVAEHGYVIGERLLRAAKVAIAAQPLRAAPQENGRSVAPGSSLDTSA